MLQEQDPDNTERREDHAPTLSFLMLQGRQRYLEEFSLGITGSLLFPDDRHQTTASLGTSDVDKG